MGQWKKMGKDYNKDVMSCPNCHGIFVRRAKGKVCPLCNIRLAYPGEFISGSSTGYIWLKSGWKKVSETLKEHNQNPTVRGQDERN